MLQGGRGRFQSHVEGSSCRTQCPFWSCSSIASVGNFCEMNGSSNSIAEILDLSGLCTESTCCARLGCWFAVLLFHGFCVDFALVEVEIFAKRNFVSDAVDGG